MKSSESLIYLHRSAYHNNLQFIKDFVGREVKVSCVVKGNAYGHGVREMIPMAMDAGMDHFSVFSAMEAEELQGICDGKADIMIYGLLNDKDNLCWAIENGIEFYVYELEVLRKAIETARELGEKAKVHFELETGMNRTGFKENELSRVIELYKEHKERIELMGICTHYAGAESIANYLRIKRQYRKFKSYSVHLKKEGLIPKYYHTACSAATMLYPKSHMDMVRVGIMQYGFWPSREVFISCNKDKDLNDDPLQHVLEWKTSVMSVKTVQAGEFVGYGNSYLANTDIKIAVVSVGYSDGFPRNLSNQGRVLVSETRVGVIGTVNMNMLTVDVTGLDVKVGDEVVIIGNQGDLDISVSSFSELSSQLNYESLLRLPRTIPRVIVD